MTRARDVANIDGVLTAKGDIYAATAAATPDRLGVGANDTVLTADSTTATGLKWATPSAGPTDWTLLNAGGTALTGATKITVSFTAPKQLFVLMVGASSGNARSFFEIRPNDDSGADYSTGGFFVQPDNITLSEGVGSYSAKTEISFGTMSNNAASVVQASLFMDFCNQTGTKFYSVTAGGNPGGGQGHQLFAQQGLMEAGATITSVAVISSTGNFDAGTLYVFGAN